MKNVLLLGGTGLLGTNWLFSRNRKENYFVNVHRKKLSKSSLKFKKVYINLQSNKKIIEFIKKNEISVLINLIAITDVEYCEKNKFNAFSINVKLTKKISEACKKTGITQIYISTDQLFNGKRKIYSEKSKISALNNYGITKSKAETIIRRTCKKHIILRSNFFCWSLKKKKNLLKEIMIKLVNKKNFYGWTNVYFTPVYARTLIDIAHYLESIDKYGVFNVSCDVPISKYTFASIITKKFSLNKSYLKKSLLSTEVYTKRPLNMSLNNSKIKKVMPRIRNKLQLKKQVNDLKNDKIKFMSVFKNV